MCVGACTHASTSLVARRRALRRLGSRGTHGAHALVGASARPATTRSRAPLSTHRRERSTRSWTSAPPSHRWWQVPISDVAGGGVPRPHRLSEDGWDGEGLVRNEMAASMSWPAKASVRGRFDVHGALVEKVNMPSHYADQRSNKGLESLALSPDAHLFVHGERGSALPRRPRRDPHTGHAGAHFFVAARHVDGRGIRLSHRAASRCR